MPRYEYDEAKRQRNLKECKLDFAAAYLVYENPNKVTAASPQKVKIGGRTLRWSKFLESY